MSSRDFEAIILAGGQGTRIRTVAPDLPKALLEVAGRPFLELLLERIAGHGVIRAILAVGYRHEQIQEYFGHRWGSVDIAYSVESLPMGTGGAARKALSQTTQEDVFVFNGDTFFDIDLGRLLEFHKGQAADVSVALKPMLDFDRYGTVELHDGRITGFREKAPARKGLVNGGVYVMGRTLLERFDLPERFSLENDFLEKKAGDIVIGGLVCEGYFIDIGVPGDYLLARRDLPRLLNGK